MAIHSRQSAPPAKITTGVVIGKGVKLSVKLELVGKRIEDLIKAVDIRQMRS
jgi:hypothetical protein